MPPLSLAGGMQRIRAREHPWDIVAPMAAPSFRAGAALHGLAAFTEAERDVFFGRDRDRDDVVKMVTADGFRAGLLYGESGVGKTSLLQAGVMPALRDHGAVVVSCGNLANPAQAFADGLLAASRGGIQPHQGDRKSTRLNSSH